MILPCFRCGKEIDRPGLVAKKTGKKDKDGKPIFESYSNADYIMAEDTKVTEIQDGLPIDIQKTGIICPNCYKPTDTVIWGIHKEK